MSTYLEDKAKRLARFLELLNAATRETGLEISGCGCCGSPSISDGAAEGGKYEGEIDKSGDLNQLGWKVDDE